MSIPENRSNYLLFDNMFVRYYTFVCCFCSEIDLNVTRVGDIMSVSEKVGRVARKHLIYFVKGSSSKGEAFTGRLVNISSNGLKLITKANLFVGDTYHLEISLSDKIDELKHITCLGKIVWYRHSTGHDHFSAGFEIVEIDDISKNFLNEVMKEFDS